ncbi:MAG: hypothetical protein FWD39_04115, partial [Clostridiales bacterium]|nr:hypothetical protein [Clostridiales bacterium]
IVSMDVGGVVGGLGYGGSLENCNFIGEVSGRSCVGGVTGSIWREGSLKYCYATGEVSGRSSVGGVVGNISGGGGMENCYSTGKVSGGNYVGGVAGQISSANSGMKNCYATGDVSGDFYVGGVVGSIGYGSSMENCYAAGTVSGSSAVGGVVGSIAGAGNVTSSIINCAALGPIVTGKLGIGRVVGQNNGPLPGTLSNNIAFFDMTVTVNGAAKTLDIGADRLGGADISAAEILADGTLGGRFTEANGWTVENGKLPGFGAAVEMPKHIK